MITPSREEHVETPRRGSRPARRDDTPLSVRMGVIARKWSLMILRQASLEERTTFTTFLRAHAGISRRVLSIRLKELQREGYLERIVSQDNPRRTAYALTAKGRDALPLVRAFSELVRRYGTGVPVSPSPAAAPPGVCYSPPEVPVARTVTPSPLPFAFPRVVPPRPVAKVAVYKPRCEKCRTELRSDTAAFVCSYDCTWCARCAERFGGKCPNCQGALQLRPPLPAPSRGRLE